MSKRSPRLTDEEIRRALETPVGQQWPIYLTTKQLASLLGLPSKTVYTWVAKGHLAGTYRKRGKYNLFWRERVIDALFNGPDWHDPSKRV